MKNNNKNENLISEEFMRKILESKNNSDIKNLFKEKGIDVSDQQVDKFKEILKEELVKIVNISDEKLNVSGGFTPNNGIAKSLDPTLNLVGDLDFDAGKIGEGSGFGFTLGGLAGFVAGLPVGLSKKGFSSEALKYAFSKGLYSAGVGAIVGGAMGADAMGKLKNAMDKKLPN